MSLNPILITKKFLIKNKKMFKRPPMAERTGIKLQTLHTRFTEGGADLTVSEAHAIIDLFNEDGIYPRQQISPKTIKDTPIIHITERWRRSGFDAVILYALNKHRRNQFEDEGGEEFEAVSVG